MLENTQPVVTAHPVLAFEADCPKKILSEPLLNSVIGEHPEIGLTGPAMHCVNAIPYVCEAEPGIKTYLDLPLIAGRATPFGP